MRSRRTGRIVIAHVPQRWRCEASVVQVLYLQIIGARLHMLEFRRSTDRKRTCKRFADTRLPAGHVDDIGEADAAVELTGRR